MTQRYGLPLRASPFRFDGPCPDQGHKDGADMFAHVLIGKPPGQALIGQPDFLAEQNLPKGTFAVAGRALYACFAPCMPIPARGRKMISR